jgi:cobalt-zinc-cadmium efflux system outer membrane protein
MKTNCIFLFILFLTADLPAAEPGTLEATHISGPPLLREILKNNPSIEAARQDWQAAVQNPEVVASMPDPMVSYGYYFVNVETRIGPLNQRIALSQKIPFPGKLGTAKRQAQEQAEIAYWRYRASIRDTLAQAKTFLAELARVDGSIVVLREQENLLRKTADSAEGLFKANQVGLPDVIRATVAAEDILTRISALEATRTATVAKLNALRRESGAPLSIPSRVHPRIPALPSLEAAMKLSVMANQELKAAGNAVARDEFAVKAARLEYYPDVTLGLDYTQAGENRMASSTERGRDPIMGTVTVNVPIWWDKLGAQKRAAEARREASIARRIQLTLDTTAMVRGAYAIAKSAKEQRVRFAEEIVPNAQSAYESVTSKYTAGTSTLTDVLDIQRAYNDAALGLVERTAAYLKAVAELERAVGEPLEQINSGRTNKTGRQP